MIPNVLKIRASKPQSQSPIVDWDDSQLLREFISSKNSEALQVIIERYSGMVMAICRRATAQHVDAEDAFQATFLILVQRAKKIRNHKSLAGWLFKVARRTAVRARTRNNNERRLTVVSDHELISEQDLFAEIAQEFQTERVDKILSDLPEKHRDPLVMFYYRQMSVREICAAKNCSQGSIEGLIKRGRDELKIQLQRAGITLSAVAFTTLIAQSQAQASQVLLPSLIEQTISNLTSPAEIASPVSESIEHLAQQEWMPMLTNSIIAKSTLITSAVLCIAVIAGSADVVGDPPKKVGSPVIINSKVGDALTDPAPGIITQLAGTEPKEEGIPAWKKKILAALSEATELQFVDTPLVDALGLIGELHDFKINMEDQSLKEIGITGDEPVNLKITNVTLEEALRKMLKPFDCSYILEDGGLKIVSQKKADSKRVADATPTIGEPPKVKVVNKKQPRRTTQAKSDEIRIALAEETDFEFQDTSLSDALDYIADFHGIKVIIDENALEDVGISTDEPINLSMSGVSLESALNIMLSKIPEPLDYIIENEVMKITTRQVANDFMEVQFYVISDELKLLVNNETDQLLELIEKVSEGPWFVTDGVGGTIWVGGNSLVVKQSQRNHRMLTRFLADLNSHLQENTSQGTPMTPLPKRAPMPIKPNPNENQGGGGGYF